MAAGVWSSGLGLVGLGGLVGKVFDINGLRNLYVM